MAIESNVAYTANAISILQICDYLIFMSFKVDKTFVF